jgi:hypothetical protein
MKRRYGMAAAVCLVAIAGTFVPNLVPAHGDTPAPLSQNDQAFENQLATYLQNLQGALTAASQNALTQPALAPKLQEEQQALALANQQLPNLTAKQLEAMQGIVGQSPSWAQEPVTLQQSLSAPKPAAPGTSFPSAYNGCSPDPGDASALFYSSWAATQAASLANAVASGMPDSVEFAPATIIAAAAYGVAQELAIVLGGQLSLKLDCLTAQSNTDIESHFPTDPSAVTSDNPQGYTPVSSQDSANTLKTLVGGVQAALTAIHTDTTYITNKLTSISNTVGTTQGTANTIKATAMGLQVRTDDLLLSIGTGTDSAPTGTTADSANGLANAINGKEDTIINNIGAFQTQAVRLSIERNMAQYSQAGSVILFELPASRGGYLETARDIVTDVVSKLQANGQSLTSGVQLYLSQGNSRFAAGDYAGAYNRYALAYQLATN